MVKYLPGPAPHSHQSSPKVRNSGQSWEDWSETISTVIWRQSPWTEEKSVDRDFSDVQHSEVCCPSHWVLWCLVMEMLTRASVSFNGKISWDVHHHHHHHHKPPDSSPTAHSIYSGFRVIFSLRRIQITPNVKTSSHPVYWSPSGEIDWNYRIFSGNILLKYFTIYSIN